ncbi:uncharacterized protein LOC116429746 [Nomia melanderi]|uniref:uncharacterized protein LOC116429746 n=1 Tax=Nomia melanderi TaxID=2448451 RepID=UPI0013040AE7|nr:uncharacterized protein LOC116429746 [Nomia melanderi]
MLHSCVILPALICTVRLIFNCATCAPDIGQPSDLNRHIENSFIPITMDEMYNAVGHEISMSLTQLYRHTRVTVFASHNTMVATVVCAESTAPRHRGYKFSMIWSRERRSPPQILKELKSKLRAYINQGEIQMVDHGNC